MLWIAGGGAMGAICRYGLGTFLSRKIKSKIPFSMILINILGSFALGIILAIFDAYSLSQDLGDSDPFYLTLSVGFLGAFTTFSTFSVETVELFQRGLYRNAFAYIFLTIVGCLLFFLIGYHLI